MSSIATDTGETKPMKPFIYRGFTFHLFRSRVEDYDSYSEKSNYSWDVQIKKITTDKTTIKNILMKSGVVLTDTILRDMSRFVNEYSTNGLDRAEVEENGKKAIDEAYQRITKNIPLVTYRTVSETAKWNW